MNNKERLDILRILRKYLYISTETITSPRFGKINQSSIKMRPINPRDLSTLLTDFDYNKVYSYLRTQEKEDK